MKRRDGDNPCRQGEEIAAMDIVWQTPAHPPHSNDYIFRDGRRHVKPYYFEFISHAKNRWAGKTIVDLFTDEFKGRPYDYYVRAVKCGRIKVDDHNVNVSYRVKSSQKISHFLHRHEPPVMAWDVSVLQEDEEVVTVYKPASVPVHPCGQYRKNTVVGILQAERGLTPLFPIHRLDRLVSGLLIFARSASKADSFRQQIEAGLVKKQYIAKVVGVFPEVEVNDVTVESSKWIRRNELAFVATNIKCQSIRWILKNPSTTIRGRYLFELVVDANVNYNAREGKSTVELGDGCADTPLKGKAACTKFRRIDTDGSCSLVLCEPHTGRTHQIRVHLQHTGYPIANDTLYLTDNTTYRSSEGTTADRASANLVNCSTSPAHENVNGCEEPCPGDFSIDPMCTNCPNLAPKGYDGHEEGLLLHCVKYTGPGWTYECPHPEWATL